LNRHERLRLREIEAQLHRQEPELARLLSTGLGRARTRTSTYSLLWCGLGLIFVGLATTWDNMIVAGLLAISAWPAQVRLAAWLPLGLRSHARSGQRTPDAFSRVDRM